MWGSKRISWRRRRRLFKYARIAVVTMACIGAVYYALFEWKPWPPLVTLRHILAAPNCDAARLMDLAPSNRGQPGYWDKHDADNDGQACEPWPR
jgi:hypothetical protein